RAPRRGARAAHWPPRSGSESGLAPCQGAGHLLRRYPEVAAPQNPPATSGYPLSILRIDQRAAESCRGFSFSAFLGGSLRLCVDCSFQDEPKNSSRLILMRFQDEPNSGRVGAWQDHAGLIHSSLSGRKSPPLSPPPSNLSDNVRRCCCRPCSG